ncbi:hypothetical protein PT974_00694 [Cladobotryum mycophilum]|uniref:Uncharacterized protein n=1 Tax=Cladobotryum mycophilum TaxID=491253 RepID=A0ABR0T1T0_9HYPO
MTYFLPPKISSSINQHIKPPLPPPSEETPRVVPQPVAPQAKPKERPSGQRAFSVGGWVKSILPSQRPERGGTHRAQGVGAESVNSNRIVRWNTAKDLSEGQSNPAPPRRRVVSAGPESLPAEDRAWSWSQEESEDQMSVSKLGGVLQNKTKTRESNKNIAAETLVAVTSVTGRRQSEVRRVVNASLESRRKRQNLKESGDYLGVQGVNPQTGEIDIMTPTDSTPRSSASMERQSRVMALQKLLRNNRHVYRKAPAEMTDEEKFLRLQKEKEKVKSMSKSVRWRRRGKQWSSAQEPDLSPITQSLRSASPSSRRQSKGKAAPRTDSSLLGRLIEFGSSKPKARPTFPEVPVADAAPPNTDPNTSNSSGTVVRTPHRRSIANPSSTAWELFENGISFDPSDGSNAPDRKAAEISPTATDNAALVGVAHSLEQQPSTDALRTPVTSPSRTTTTKLQDPFLGLRAKRQLYPGNLQESMKIRIDMTPNTAQALAAAAMDSPSPPEGKRGIIKTPSSQSIAEDLEIQSILEKQSLRKAAPHLVYLKRRRAGGIQPEDGAKEKPKPKATPMLHWRSVTNLRKKAVDMTKNLAVPRQEQERPVTEQSVEQDIPLTKHMIEEEMQMLKLRVASLDSVESKASVQRINQGETDQDWIDSTIQDMKTKADEVMDLSLSIPTITTTGCDHQTCQSSLKYYMVQGPEETQTQRPWMVRPLSRVIYNLPVAGSSELSLENFPAEPLSNSVSSVMSLEQDVPATDTISIVMSFSEEQGKPSAEGSMQGETAESQRHSILRKSMSTQPQGVMQGRPLTQDHSVEEEVGEPMQQKVVNPVGNMRPRMTEQVRVQTREARRTEDAAETAAERQTVCLDTELGMLVRCPGRYPLNSEGEGEDDTGNHSEASVFEVFEQSLQDE